MFTVALSSSKTFIQRSVVTRNFQLAFLHSSRRLQNENCEETPSVEEELKLEVKKLKESICEFKDKYQRSLAETENVRQRMKKQIEDAKVFGIQSFCKDLLSVADIMKMAIKSIPDEELSNCDSLWAGLHQGVVMTDKELHSVFERHGLTMISAEIGEKFDPNQHEALFEVPSDQMEAGMIAHVEQNGYQLKGRNIRAVKVGVSKKL